MTYYTINTDTTAVEPIIATYLNINRNNMAFGSVCVSSTKIVPCISDVAIVVPNKVVEVTFRDGTKEKSVCREPDVFSLETAISICIVKKVMGGSSAYNNAVKNGMKVYENKLAKEIAKKEEEKRIEKKRAKRLAYKKRRDEKRAEVERLQKQAEREEQIEIQKEAYIRAMTQMNNK